MLVDLSGLSGHAEAVKNGHFWGAEKGRISRGLT